MPKAQGDKVQHVYQYEEEYVTELLLWLDARTIDKSQKALKAEMDRLKAEANTLKAKTGRLQTEKTFRGHSHRYFESQKTLNPMLKRKKLKVVCEVFLIVKLSVQSQIMWPLLLSMTKPSRLMTRLTVMRFHESWL